MARRDDDDDDDAFQEKRPPAKPTRSRQESVQPPRPRAARSSRDEEDEDYDDRDDRRAAAIRGRPAAVSADDDAVATIIPYRNGMALAGYYLGVFSLIPLLGALLGPLAIIFGIVGLRRVSQNPEAKGTGHAVTAIVLGGIGALYNWGIVILFFIGVLARR